MWPFEGDASANTTRIEVCSACPTCLDHGIYGDVDDTTGDVVDTYCACLHGQARRAGDEG